MSNVKVLPEDPLFEQRIIDWLAQNDIDEKELCAAAGLSINYFKTRTRKVMSSRVRRALERVMDDNPKGWSSDELRKHITTKMEEYAVQRRVSWLQYKKKARGTVSDPLGVKSTSAPKVKANRFSDDELFARKQDAEKMRAAHLEKCRQAEIERYGKTSIGRRHICDGVA